MQTIHPTLAAAMQTGTGMPIARAAILTNTYELVSYKWDNLKFECYIFGAAVASYQDPITVTRGLDIGGTQYLVSIGMFFIETVRLDKFGNTSLICHALPSGALSGVDADDDLLTVLDRAGTDYALDFKAIPNAQDWLDTWATFKPDNTLDIASMRLLEHILRQKRRAFLFQRCDGIYVTNPPSDMSNYASVHDLTLPEFADHLSTRLRSLYCFWNDENNFKYYNFAGGGTPETYSPKHNLGYIHSSVNANAVGTLGMDGGGQFQFKQFPNLALEQGEPVITAEYGQTIIRFIEKFNWPGDKGWKQIVIDQHWQPFGGYGAEPIIVNDFSVTNIFQEIVTNIITEIFYLNYYAADVNTSTGNFDGIFNASHNTIQACLEALDNHQHGDLSWYLYENFY